MKPSYKQHQTAAPPVQRPAVTAETNVHRYAHPIRISKPPVPDPMEEMLTCVLEALSRQSEQLNEVLRRLDGDNSDTM